MLRYRAEWREQDKDRERQAEKDRERQAEKDRERQTDRYTTTERKRGKETEPNKRGGKFNFRCKQVISFGNVTF